MYKLTQHGSVDDYLSEFESLANHIIGLPPPFLLSCFISSPTLQIRQEVQVLQPLTLVQVVGLARLPEEKFQDLSHLSCGKPLPPTLTLPPYHVQVCHLPSYHHRPNRRLSLSNSCPLTSWRHVVIRVFVSTATRNIIVVISAPPRCFSSS